MPKPSIKKNSNGTIYPIVGGGEGVHSVLKSICRKLNAVVWLEIELVYYDVAV